MKQFYFTYQDVGTVTAICGEQYCDILDVERLTGSDVTFTELEQRAMEIYKENNQHASI